MSTDTVSVNPQDLVVVRLSLRSREGQTIELNIAPRISELNLVESESVLPQPQFPTEKFTAAATAGDADAILRIQAEFNLAVAEFVQAGEVPLAERLATAVVDFIVRTSPGGHEYTTDSDSSAGFVINTGEINMSGPHQMGDERVFRVTAVGTWGI